MAIVFDTASLHFAVSGSATGSHTSTGVNRVVLVWAQGTEQTGITYGGEPMTNIESIRSDFQTWGLVNPPTGTQVLELSRSGSGAWSFQVLSYTGVDQVTPWSGVLQAYNTGQALVTVSSAVGNLVVGAHMSGHGGGYVSVTPGANQTERSDALTWVEGNYGLSWATSDEPGDTSVVHDYIPDPAPSSNQIVWGINLNAAPVTILGKPGNFTQGKRFILNQSPSNGKLMRITNG